jgi:Fur family ferric uptake transcriptional regulator
MYHYVAVEELESRLHQAGYRITAPRRAVLTALRGSDRALAASELLQRAREHCPGMGRATLYRTLGLLLKLGVVWPVPTAQGIKYRLAAGSVHRLICWGCGAEIPLSSCPAGDMAAELSQRYGYAISGHTLVFYGLCPDCQRRLNHGG